MEAFFCSPSINTILFILLFLNNGLLCVESTDPAYCSNCDVWTAVEDLQIFDVYAPLNSFATGTYPVITSLVSAGGEGEIMIVYCSSDICVNTYKTFIQISDNFYQVVSTPLSGGDYVVGARDFSGVTNLFDCQNQPCSTKQSSTVSWHIADSIAIAAPFGSKYPILFGAISSLQQVEFNLCQDAICSGSNYHYVNVSLLSSTATNSSFAIDGHSNYVALVQMSGSTTDLIMVFCHNQGTNCTSSTLRKPAGISQFSVVAPPDSQFYQDGKSYVAIQVCRSNSPVSVTFCLSDYCIQNTTANFGTSAKAAAVAYGPNNFPVIVYLDNSGAVYITQCFDYTCGTFMTPKNLANSIYYFVAITATRNSDFILISALDTANTLWTTLFCGPFITNYSPNDAPLGQSTLVDVTGYFCSASASTCKYGNSTSNSTLYLSTELSCTIDLESPYTGPISIGNSAWTEYSTVGNFTFYGPSSSPTPSPSAAPTPTSTPSPSSTPSSSSSSTPTATATPSSTASITPAASASASMNPQPSASPTPSHSPADSPTPTSTPSSFSTPSVSSVPSISSSPSSSANPSSSPTSSASSSTTPSVSPSPTNSSTHPDNTNTAITMISIVLTAFFAASVITTYAYFRWSKAKKYRPSAIHVSWDNFITFIAVPLDFLQFCAFSTNIKAEWAQLIYKISKGTIFEIPNTAYLALFWIVLITTAAWCIYIAPFFIRIDWKGNRTPLVEWLKQRKIFKAIYYPASLFMIPFGNCLFFAISNVLLQMVSCKYWADTDHPVLNMDDSIQCWTGVHIFLSVLTMIVFFAYFPMAIHLMPKLQQVSLELEVKYNEKFLFISSMLKLVICVVHALFAEWEVPRLMTVCAVTLILTIINMEMEPCNVQRVNSVRSAIYFAACCCAICSVGATFTSKTNIVPLVILLLCWAIILILLALAQLGVVHNFIRRKNNQLLRILQDDEINEEHETYIKFG